MCCCHVDVDVDVDVICISTIHTLVQEEDSYEVGEREPPRYIHQLKLLLWKNWLLRKRTCGSTCMGIMLPVIVVLLVSC